MDGLGKKQRLRKKERTQNTKPEMKMKTEKFNSIQQKKKQNYKKSIMNNYTPIN